MPIATKEEAVAVIEHLRDRAAAKLKEFRDSVQSARDVGLCDSLSWQSWALEAAATFVVMDAARACYDPPRSPQEAYEWLARETLKAARYPKRSTDPLANLMAEYRVSALAGLVDDLGVNGLR